MSDGRIKSKGESQKRTVKRKGKTQISKPWVSHLRFAIYVLPSDLFFISFAFCDLRFAL